MIARTSGTWLFGVLLVLVVPAVLVGIWSWLVFGGAIERLAARERDEVRDAVEFVRGAIRAGLDGRPDRPDATSGRVWLRVDASGTLDPDPFPQRPANAPEPAQVDPLWQAGIAVEAEGAPARALRFLEHARDHAAAPAPIEGWLAMARAYVQCGDPERALAVLDAVALREENRARVDDQGFDVAFLARFAACGIAAETGDPEPSRALLARVGSFAEAIPLAAQESVLERLVRWSGEPPPWLPFHRALCAAVATLRAGSEPRASDALLLARPAADTWLCIDPRHADRLVTTVIEAVPERWPDHVAGTAHREEPLWTESLPWLERRLHLDAREERESLRLASLAQRLLVVALFAFVVGNALVARSLRQERRLARLRSAFVDLVSHELRTPLTALSLRTELLARDAVPQEKRASYAERIHRDVQRLSALTARILDFARLEKGRLPLARARTNSRVLLARALAETRSVLRDAGLRVRVHAPRAEAAPLRVDPDVASRALSNLLENAAKHALGTAAVWIEVRPEGEHVAFHVDDAGPGIDPAERDAVFRPFERGKDAAGRPGSGLGLSFVRQALHAHGGTVRVAASPRGGARFTLIFPREERP